MDDLNFSKPVACSLTSASQRAETRRFKMDLVPHVLTRESLADGARLTFTNAPGLREKIDRLVELDKGCCTFLDHHVESDGKTITLTVRSQGQGIVLAQEFLGVLTPSGSKMTWMLLVGACGLACAAPMVIGAAGLSAASIGFGVFGFGLGTLGLAAAGIAAYVYYRKRNAT